MQCCSSILVDQIWLYKMEVACSDIPDIMFRQSTNSMFRQSHWSPVLFIFTVVLNFFTVILSLINSMLSSIHVSYARLQNVFQMQLDIFSCLFIFNSSDFALVHQEKCFVAVPQEFYFVYFCLQFCGFCKIHDYDFMGHCFSFFVLMR